MEQKNKQLMIFLAGELRSKDNLLKRMKGSSFDYYAADGGYLLAKQLGVRPKKIFGDFDSAPKPQEKNLLIFPKEKDQTDSEIALELAAQNGYRDIWMIAPFGGRLDHTVANLSLLDAAHEKGVNLRLYDGENIAFLLWEGIHKIEPTYRYISFFPYENEATISLRGVKYPLDRYTLIRSKPIGVSNEPWGDVPVAEIHNGTVLCICIENHQEAL